jgi:hypothetical protein
VYAKRVSAKLCEQLLFVLNVFESVWREELLFDLNIFQLVLSDEVLLDGFEPGYGTNPEAPRPYRQAVCAPITVIVPSFISRGAIAPSGARALC